MDINWFKRLTASVLALTDEFGIHREAVSVSLDREGAGGMTVVGQKVSVVGPADDDLEAFTERLRAELGTADLSALPKGDPADY